MERWRDGARGREGMENIKYRLELREREWADGEIGIHPSN